MSWNDALEMDWREFQLILDSVIRVVNEEKEAMKQSSGENATPIDPEARAQEIRQA